MRKILWIAFVGLLALVPVGQAQSTSCATPIQGAQSVQIALPGHPFAVVVTADDCWLFVSMGIGQQRGAVAVLRNRGGTFALDHVAALPGAGLGAALTHDGAVLVVATGDDVAALDVAALERGGADPLLGKLHDGSGAGAVYAAISRDDQLLFVSDEHAHRLSVFNLAAARHDGFSPTALIGHIPTGRDPVGLALSPDGRWLYATSQVAPPAAGWPARCAPEMRREREHAPGLLLRIDVERARRDPAGAVVEAVQAGCNPVRVAVAPSGQQLWVSARDDNALLRFQTADLLATSGHATYARFPIGTSPVGVAVRPDGRQVWAALSSRFGADTAGRLAGLADASTSAPTQQLSAAAAGFPREVTFLHDGRTLAVTLYDTDRIELLSTPP